MSEQTNEHTTPTLEQPRVLQGSLSRYEIHVDGSGTPAGVTWFQDVEGSDGATERVFTHTEVEDELSGRGLGSTLVRGALDATIAAGYRIVPSCPYVRSWLEKHPEYREHLVIPTREHLQAIAGR